MRFMHKKYFLGLIVFAVGLAVHAQDAVSNSLSSSSQLVSGSPLAPAISFAEEVYDFGKLAEGVAVHHEFVFTNTGAATVIVDRVEPDCHCTTVTNWSGTVAPGKTGTIPVQYQSRGYNGPIDQTINVFCNGSPQPATVLHMRGVVWQAIEVNPTQVVFNLGLEQKTNSTRSLRIRSWEGELFLNAPPESNNKAFAAEVRTNIPGKDYYVDIRTTGRLSPGKIESSITLKTSSSNLSLITIPVSSTVASAIIVMPAAIVLTPGPLTKEMTVKVSLRNNNPPPVSVKSAIVTLPEVQVETKEIQAGHLFYFTVRFPVGFKLKPGQDTGMIISTTNAEFPELRVPISQMQLAESAL